MKASIGKKLGRRKRRREQRWTWWHGKNGTPKDKFEAGLRDLIEKISDAGATIVLATPSVIGEKTDGSNKLDALLDEYAAISRTVAKDTGTTLCDLRVAFIERLKEINPDNKERGVQIGRAHV